MWDFERNDLFIFRLRENESSRRSDSPVPSILFSRTCFNLLRILIVFFPPLQMKMIILHHLLRSWWLCEGGSAESLSLSCHSLERHVNSTYRLLGGVTHRRRDNLICDAFSPRLEHIYTQPLIEIATPDWIFGRASLEWRAPGHWVAAPLLQTAPDINPLFTYFDKNPRYPFLVANERNLSGEHHLWFSSVSFWIK